MAKDLFWTTVTFVIVLGVLVLAFWPQNRSQVVVKYDCRLLMGGWHPDVPLAVQEECRKRSTK
jgi:hypothetical protein